MKLFLASSFDKTISLFLEKMPKQNKNRRVVFIANAADPYEGDKWWVDLDREAFKNNGFEIIELDLRKISQDEFSKRLNSADILHFCGGSVFYLLYLIREKRFENVIKYAVSEGNLIYTGTSAGSMIVANSVKSDSFDGDPEEKEFIGKLPDFNGLGLVNFLIMPHCNSTDFTDNNIKTIKRLPELNTPLIMLYDNQAVWVEDGKMEILEKM